MATLNFPTPDAHQAACMSRANAMVCAIEAICEQLEDKCGDAVSAFPLITAIEACARVARQELDTADNAETQGAHHG